MARELTAEDAEALLLALGASLEWGDATRFAEHLHPDAEQCQTAAVEAGFYCVYIKRERRGCWLAAWQSVNPATIKDDFCPNSFDTQAEAKVACERYHATGKWEQIEYIA